MDKRLYEEIIAHIKEKQTQQIDKLHVEEVDYE